MSFSLDLNLNSQTEMNQNQPEPLKPTPGQDGQVNSTNIEGLLQTRTGVTAVNSSLDPFASLPAPEPVNVHQIHGSVGSHYNSHGVYEIATLTIFGVFSSIVIVILLVQCYRLCKTMKKSNVSYYECFNNIKLDLKGDPAVSSSDFYVELDIEAKPIVRKGTPKPFRFSRLNVDSLNLSDVSYDSLKAGRSKYSKRLKIEGADNTSFLT